MSERKLSDAIAKDIKMAVAAERKADIQKLSSAMATSSDDPYRTPGRAVTPEDGTPSRRELIEQALADHGAALEASNVIHSYLVNLQSSTTRRGEASELLHELEKCCALEFTDRMMAATEET